MKYNEEQIHRYVKEKRRAFLIKSAILLALILISEILIAIFPEVTVIFICTLVIIFSSVQLIKTLKREHPLILFSKEIKGVNVHEHEYTTGYALRLSAFICSSADGAWHSLKLSIQNYGESRAGIFIKRVANFVNIRLSVKQTVYKDNVAVGQPQINGCSNSSFYSVSTAHKF